MSETSLVFYI